MLTNKKVYQSGTSEAFVLRLLEMLAKEGEKCRKARLN
jgi:hypothetical protein